MTRATRLSLEETWKHLEEQNEEMPRADDGEPFVPPGIPSQDDEELGYSFFRNGVEDGDYSGLTLPRTYFCRSSLTRVTFQNSDLHESRMCWNDFIECDFSGADLSKCDLRSSTYEKCNFSDADLRGADLRRAYIVECTFAGSLLEGAVALPDGHPEACEDGTLTQSLSTEQRAAMTWTDDAGDEPDGG